MRTFIRVMVVAVFAGCAPPRNTEPAVTAIGEPTGATVTAMVGPNGGTVRSANGELELIIPAGALAAETAMTVTPISVTAPGGVKAWRLGPEGTTFAQAATVKMSFTDEEVGATLDGLRIAYQDSERRWLAYKSSTRDGNTIAVQTDHLSDWSMVLGWQLRPHWPLVQIGSTIELSPQSCGFPKNADDLRYFIAECGNEGLDRFFVNWSVNGIPGGNSEVGTMQGNAMARTYTAPAKVPSPSRVAASVEWIPPDPDGKKILLVSNITVWGELPTLYRGTIDYHVKQGGTGTSTLPIEYRVTAPLKLKFASNGNYDLEESQATLVAFMKMSDISNCRCTAENALGTIQANTGAFIMRDGVVKNLQFTALFTVPMVCTGSTDPGCANYTTTEVVSWSLTGQNPACMNNVKATYADPAHVNGSWETICPVNPQTLGREEEMRWSLTADR